MSLAALKAQIEWAGKEAWYKGNLDALDEVYAQDMISRRPPFPDIVGLPAVKQFIAGGRQGYSDIQADYEEFIAEGSSIAYRYTMRMKHTGVSPSLPIPATGKELVLKGCVVVHLKDGKIVEELEYSDYLGYLQQLGVVPSLG
jgi:steroid delta-isomerase-like uncharacterized protein